MRELERPPDTPATLSPVRSTGLAVVGRGRLGTALCRALAQRGIDVGEPLPRGADGGGADAVVLCVPDAEITAAASLIAPGRLVGHCSGASALTVLAPHEGFSLHPLMTFAASDGAARFEGAGAAVAGCTPRALRFARDLALELAMHPFEIAEDDRPTYHAAASIASNFLITLEAAAQRLAVDAGADPDALLTLVRATVDNWAARGPAALTGPVARGDEATVAAQRAAVAEHEPELLELFDAMVDSTRVLAAQRIEAVAL
jgi:predicted short-subunit dehydrogenase-like oxidoreductase (DUF2520 family)